MNRTLCLLVSLSLMLLSSCSSYVGVHVDSSHPNYCNMFSSQHPCKITDEDFRVQLAIDKLDSLGNYVAKGHMAILGKANFNQITSLRITVFLINNNVVVDSFIHSVSVAEIGKEIPIERKFTTDQQFNAIVIGYNYRVQG